MVVKHLGTASPQCVPGSESCPGKLQALVGEHRFTLVRAWSHEGNPVTPIDAPLAFLVAEILLNVFWPSNQSFSTVTGHLCSSMFLVLLGKNQEIFYLKGLWVCLLSRTHATRVFSWRRSFYPSAKELQGVFINISSNY